MATLDPFTQVIQQLLMNTPQLKMMMEPGQRGEPAKTAPREPLDLAGLSGGEGDAAPLPQEPIPSAPAPQAAGLEQGPIGKMLGLGPETSQMLRRFGGGMANIKGNPYGDPFITMAQGFGGAQAAGADQEATLKAEAAAQQKAMLDAQKDQREATKDAADLKLRTLAEDRMSRTAELANKKSAIEIKRMARRNGITEAQVLEIERIAQAAGENLRNEARQKAIDETRQRLIGQLQAGEGITGASGGISQQEYEAEDANGNTVVFRNGQWVDPDTDEPWGQ